MPNQRSTPLLMDNDANARKRVCKACDRCRLKKSKCDGTTPCSRCKADNAICVFGERKKAHDKIYPKGYVEMLEQQQTQLVNGLQELYSRAVSGQGWDGPPLIDNGGKPLTHDILDYLGVLQQESNISVGSFDDNLESMQQRLISQGADLQHCRSSPDPDSEQDLVQPPTFDLDSQRQMDLTTMDDSEILSTPAQRRSSTRMNFPARPDILAQLHPSTQIIPLTQQSTPAMNGPPPSSPPTARALVRPHQSNSMQIHPGYANWEGRMGPVVPQNQHWIESPISMDDASNDFVQSDWSNYEMAPMQSQMQFTSSISIPDCSMTEWADVDYNSFMNPVRLNGFDH